MASGFAYDVFLSHSSKDKPVVRELAHRLEADGLRVWFDEWEIKPGDTVGRRIEEGLEQSRVLVLCMSRYAFASDWAMLESGTFRFRDPANKERRFVPVRLDGAEVTDALKQFAYVDWREKADDGYRRLLAACRPAVGRAARAPKAYRPLRPTAVLDGHTAGVPMVALTPDGGRAFSASSDRTARVWDLQERKLVATFHEYDCPVWGVALSSDGRWAIACGEDGTVRVWDLDTAGHTVELVPGVPVATVAISADGRRALTGGWDNDVWVWDLGTGDRVARLAGHADWVSSVAIAADGRYAVSGSGDHTIRVWDLDAGMLIATLEGHTGAVRGVALAADGERAVSGSADHTIRIWDLKAGKPIARLEGHTDEVYTVGVTANGRRAISGSKDSTVRVWDLDRGRQVAMLDGCGGAVWKVAIGSDGHRAASGAAGHSVLVWDLLPSTPRSGKGAGDVRYTNAKVLLVGDSGVGKTGLAYRLAENRFRDSVSTDAVWATQLQLPHTSRRAGTEREIWLWDFAGQADYRLIHQLFMDETALAVFVFNPQSENPFDGLGQWDRDLRRAARRPFQKLLVAGRCDRGGLMVSRGSIEQFGEERGFAGYVETSALRGSGCGALRDAIVRQIPWEDILWTSSPRVFRLLKSEIVKLKDEGKVLLRMGELRQQLEMRLPQQAFTVEELRSVVGLLAGPGVVWQLEFGGFVLLQPELVNSYAAAVIRSVRAHVEEIGCIAEERVLAGDIDYQGMRRLPAEEERIVLLAMHQTFVDHGLCLREHTEAGTLLIFPSYFRRERPELAGHPAVLVTYQFSGSLEEIYATLVVRLHHTQDFERHQLWRFAADFQTQSKRRLGFKMTRKAEGAAELAVYLEPDIPDDTKVAFIRYVHEHLKLRASDVVRLRHYVCPHCHTPVENRKTAYERLERGLKDIVCVNCEKRVPLWDLIEEKFASEEFQRRVRGMEEQARVAIGNESRELILVGHAYATAGEAGQIYRQYANSDHGIDGEIEFRDYEGKASGSRLYLQLKSGDSYLRRRKEDGAEIFTIRSGRHAEYWQRQAYPVMLVVRTSDGSIRWMDVSAHLKRQTERGRKVKQIVFEGEPLTALSVRAMRDRLLGPPPASG